MRKLKLGLTEIEISQFGLGCVNFGTTVSESLSYKLMDTYIENGGNFFDTANNYAVWNGGDGRESERAIGAWLKATGNRENIVLATKLGALVKDEKTSGFSQMQGLSEQVIFEEVEKSMKTMGVDRIDLLYLHVDDFETDQEEYMAALNKLTSKGYVKAIGCSNFLTWRIETARQICKKHDYPFFSAVQQRLSYLNPVMDADLHPQIPYNKELGQYLDFNKDMTLVAYSTLLDGMYNKDTITHKAYQTVYGVEKFAEVKKHKNPNTFVINQVADMHNGTVVLLTSSKPEHLIESIQSTVKQ
mgnify:CR=1 FL=1